MASILYLTNAFGTPDEPNAGAAARHYFHVKALADTGNTVTVITANASTVGTTSSHSTKNYGNVKVIYANVGSPPTKNILSRLVYFLRYAVSGIFIAVREGARFDCIVASSPSIFIPVQGWILAVLKRAKLVVDVRDLWCDAVETVPFLIRTRWQRPIRMFLIWLNRNLEIFAYRRADLLFGSSKSQVEFIKSCVSSFVPVHQAPNGFDAKLAEEAAQSAEPDYLHNLRRAYAKIALFAGKFTSYTDLENVVEAAEHLESSIAIVLLGGGYTKAIIQQKAVLNNIHNVYFHEPVSKREALRYMKHADLLLINYSPELAWSKTVPGKFYDYLYFNRPVVAAALPGELTDLMEEAGTDFVVPPREPIALAKAIERASKTDVETREFLIQRFDRAKHADKFAEAVNALFK